MTARTARALAVLLAAAAGPGCGPPCEELAADGPWVKVGTGDDAFTEVAEGEVLAPAFGSQGGQHVWGGLRAGNVRLGPLPGPAGAGDANPLVAFTIADADGEIGRNGPSRVAMSGGSKAGVTVFLDVSAYSTPWLWPDGWDPTAAHDWEEEVAAAEAAQEELESRDLVLRVELEDSCGALVADERTIRLDGVEVL